MKMWTGLLILLLAVGGCSYQGEDPQGESGAGGENTGGTAAPGETPWCCAPYYDSSRDT